MIGLQRQALGRPRFQGVKEPLEALQLYLHASLGGLEELKLSPQPPSKEAETPKKLQRKTNILSAMGLSVHGKF